MGIFDAIGIDAGIVPQDRKKQLSQVCGTGAGIYHTDRYHWLYRKGNGGKSECDTDRSGDLPDPDFHFAGGIRENTERQKDTKGYQLRKWIFDRCSTGLCHTSGTFPLRYDDRGVPDERI